MPLCNRADGDESSLASLQSFSFPQGNPTCRDLQELLQLCCVAEAFCTLLSLLKTFNELSFDLPPNVNVQEIC